MEEPSVAISSAWIVVASNLDMIKIWMRTGLHQLLAGLRSCLRRRPSSLDSIKRRPVVTRAGAQGQQGASRKVVAKPVLPPENQYPELPRMEYLVTNSPRSQNMLFLD